MGISSAVTAVPLFTVDVTVGDRRQSFSFSDVSKVFDQIDEERLRTAFSNYTDMSEAHAMVDFRGLGMNFSFPGAGTSLVFEVPSLDIREEFNGATRDASVDQLEDFLKSQGGDILSRIQAASIATSPVDPIAGNPGSMMATMVSRQFEAGFSSQVTNIVTTPANSASDGEPGTATALEPGSPDNLVHLSPRFGRYTAGGGTSNVLTLPLGYSFRLKEGGTGLRNIDITMPLTYSRIEGGRSAAASIGAGLTWGLNERWSLSPAVGAGLAGSVDPGAAGGIGSASLTSAYTIPFRHEYTINIGNMIGYYETLDIEVGKYSFDPGVSNTVLRNGLMLSVPGTMGGRKVATEFWAIDTRFLGSELYSEYNDEFGISFGSARTEGRSIENYLRGGVSYMTGDNVKGWRFNLGYSF